MEKVRSSHLTHRNPSYCSTKYYRTVVYLYRPHSRCVAMHDAHMAIKQTPPNPSFTTNIRERQNPLLVLYNNYSYETANRSLHTTLY